MHVDKVHLPIAGITRRTCAMIAFAAHDQLQPVGHWRRGIWCVSVG